MKIINLPTHIAPPSIEVKVVFGAPSQSCAGSGICKMLPRTFSTPSTSPLHDKIRKGTLTRSPNGDIRLSFLSTELSGDESMQLRAGKTFVLEEQFKFPYWVIRKLKCDYLTISAGAYSMVWDDKLNIHFPKNAMQGRRFRLRKDGLRTNKRYAEKAL